MQNSFLWTEIGIKYKGRTAHTPVLGEYARTLSENRRTSNVQTSVFIISRYSPLCAEYVLGTSKFSEKTNIGEYYMGKSVLAITRQFMRKRPRMLRIFGICLFSSILRELTYVRFRLYILLRPWHVRGCGRCKILWPRHKKLCIFWAVNIHNAN